MEDCKMSGLTHDILSKVNIGLWSVVKLEGRATQMFADEKMLDLLGTDSSKTPEEIYRIWMENIEEESRAALAEYSAKIGRGEFAEVQYLWLHPRRGPIYIRCSGMMDKTFENGFRAEGFHQDVTELVMNQRKAAEADLSTNIAKTLSKDYQTIVYVNLLDNTFVKINDRKDLESKGLQLRDPDYFKNVQGNILKFVYEDDREMMLQFFQRETILRELEEASCVTRTFRIVVDGQLVYHRVKVIRSSNDKDHMVFAMENIDEEERIRTEQKNEEIYRNNVINILARNFTGLYLFNTSDDIRKAVKISRNKKNAASEEFFGCEDLQKAMIRFVHTEVHPDDREMMENALCTAEIMKRLAHKRSLSIEFRRNYNGEYKYTEMMVAKVEAINDPPVNVAVGFIENDDEVRAKLEQKRILERDLSVISGLCDDFGCVVYVDSETGKEFSYRLNPRFKSVIPDWMKIENFWERLEKFANNIVHPEDRAVFVSATAAERIKTILEKEKICFVNFRILLNDEVIYYQAKFVKDEKSKNHFVAGFHNVDEETKREMAALEKAEMANRAKTSFLFNMSHDIRTPMNSIMGFTDMAIKNVDNKEKTLDCLQKAKSSSDHLLSLLNDILDMSRIESGRLDITEVPVNLLQCVRDTFPMLNSLAEKKNISFSFDTKNVKDMFVFVDYLRINQVIINLVSNAIKYTPEGGKVDAFIDQKKGAVNGGVNYAITVKDNGVGMDEEFQKHMFEQFSREKTSTISGQQGTGLGLAITKSIVDKMNGTIEVESKLGVGSTFCVTLPLRLQETPEENEQYSCVRSNVDSYNFNGKKVLVVEDNPLNREITEDLLLNSGFDVECAEDGCVAVEKLRLNGPDYYDCILMDVQMPVMNGYEASMAIRKMYPNKRIPIVALSANAFEDDRKKSLEAGMDDHQSKPIVISVLLEALNKLL